MSAFTRALNIQKYLKGNKYSTSKSNQRHEELKKTHPKHTKAYIGKFDLDNDKRNSLSLIFSL